MAYNEYNHETQFFCRHIFDQAGTLGPRQLSISRTASAVESQGSCAATTLRAVSEAEFCTLAVASA